MHFFKSNLSLWKKNSRKKIFVAFRKYGLIIFCKVRKIIMMTHVSHWFKFQKIVNLHIVL